MPIFGYHNCRGVSSDVSRENIRETLIFRYVVICRSILKLGRPIMKVFQEMNNNMLLLGGMGMTYARTCIVWIGLLVCHWFIDWVLFMKRTVNTRAVYVRCRVSTCLSIYTRFMRPLLCKSFLCIQNIVQLMLKSAVGYFHSDTCGLKWIFRFRIFYSRHMNKMLKMHSIQGITITYGASYKSVALAVSGLRMTAFSFSTKGTFPQSFKELFRRTGFDDVPIRFCICCLQLGHPIRMLLHFVGEEYEEKTYIFGVPGEWNLQIVSSKLVFFREDSICFSQCMNLQCIYSWNRLQWNPMGPK